MILYLFLDLSCTQGVTEVLSEKNIFFGQLENLDTDNLCEAISRLYQTCELKYL